MTFSPAPLILDEVLDPAWLSWALSQQRTRVDVAGIEVLELLGPSATKARFVVDYASEQPADMPKQLCLKGVFNPKLTEYLQGGAQQTEAYFYRDIAPNLNVRVPRSFYSDSDPSTRAGVTIMAELIPEGARFLSALSPYSPDQALGSLDQLARLHGGSWQLPQADAPWIVARLEALAQSRVVTHERLTEMLQGDRGLLLPDAVRSGPRVFAAIGALGARGRSLPTCYVHGDAHGGNVWELGEAVGLIDWQCLQREHWSIDFAYHVAAALEIEDRRASEQDLLRYYLDRLVAHGGEAPAWDEAWRQYREAIAYGFFMWGITQRVEPEIINTFVGRLGTALVDHDGFGLLGV